MRRFRNADMTASASGFVPSTCSRCCTSARVAEPSSCGSRPRIRTAANDGPSCTHLFSSTRARLARASGSSVRNGRPRGGLWWNARDRERPAQQRKRRTPPRRKHPAQAKLPITAAARAAAEPFPDPRDRVGPAQAIVVATPAQADDLAPVSDPRGIHDQPVSCGRPNPPRNELAMQRVGDEQQAARPLAVAAQRRQQPRRDHTGAPQHRRAIHLLLEPVDGLHLACVDDGLRASASAPYSAAPALDSSITSMGQHHLAVQYATRGNPSGTTVRLRTTPGASSKMKAGASTARPTRPVAPTMLSEKASKRNLQNATQNPLGSAMAPLPPQARMKMTTSRSYSGHFPAQPIARSAPFHASPGCSVRLPSKLGATLGKSRRWPKVHGPRAHWGRVASPEPGARCRHRASPGRTACRSAARSRSPAPTVRATSGRRVRLRRATLAC